jgi:flagellar hook-associated protein 3 FlgL
MAIWLRVTTNGTARRASATMAAALGRLAQAQDTIASGKRVQRASDDPVASVQILKLNDLLGDVSQYKRNGEQGSAYLAQADSALDGVGSLVREAKTIMLQATSETVNAAGSTMKNALNEQLGRIREQIIHLGATQVNGRFIFSGQKSDAPPFDAADATNTYQGDSGAIRLETNRNEFAIANLPGDALFGQILTDIDTARKNILSDNGAVASDVQAMSDGVDRILSARGTIGSRVNQIENSAAYLSTTEQELRTRLSNNEDADIAQTFVELQAAQNVYQASLASTARSFESSLMDYLR